MRGGSRKLISSKNQQVSPQLVTALHIPNPGCGVASALGEALVGMAS